MEGRAKNPAASVAVVAVPFPAQGHLNQLLHLSLELASRGLDVHYAASPPHVRQARARVHGWDDDALRSIHFHDLAISTYVSPPPDPAADPPFPSHLMPMFEAFTAGARAPLAAVLRELSASRRRVVVVHDLMNAFGFYCTAVSSIVGRMDAGHRLLRDNGLTHLPTRVSQEFLDYASKRAMVARSISDGAGIVVNTCRALEGEFVDVVAEQTAADGKKLFAIGPLNPLLEATASNQGKTQRHECLSWLDQQPPSSVLYVSFGSSSSLREEQAAELAAALHGSKQRFIWVLRDADRGDIFTDAGDNRHAELLSQFTKQTEGMGLVITGWAPQLEILAHRATAAFMSHCGWNSTMESMSHGKPILAWPMHSDQPWDAELVCSYLKAGLLVRPWEKHGEVIPATTIQEAIETMMVAEEGLAVRQRAEVLGEAVRSSAAQGGSSHKEMDDFISYMTR
ncbi:unnamed protein product [Triticum turgidum subsp. durum]|uniref:Glycosyltransferase n=1 Tax=Triticum turgidum subsp. durum TaxID=4567 RepID=A0A9R1P1V8_TRITD|nr:unnamed protein product [Triticum turgidum subsp. durum]